MDTIEKIFDDENNENIILYNADDEPVEFEQIAVITLENDVTYVLLHPLGDGEFEDNEALVFEIAEEDGEEFLRLCGDDATVDLVFEEYYRLLREAGVEV